MQSIELTLQLLEGLGHIELSCPGVHTIKFLGLEVELSATTSEREIYGVAKVYIREHGDDAVNLATTRADELLWRPATWTGDGHGCG